MRKILSVVLTMLYSIIFNCSFSQVVVDITRKPIPYVYIILSSAPNQLWQTDINGIIPKQSILKMTELDTIRFQHISFANEAFTLEDLRNQDSITLSYRNYELQEVKISSKLPKYHKIDACFRNTVIQDHEPIYFSDGKATYFSRNKKLNYTLKRHEYRAFENIDGLNDTYSVSIPVNNAYTPILEEFYLPFQFINKHKLELLLVDSFNLKIMTRDSLVIGELKKQDNFIEYNLNNIFDIKTRKLLNTEVDVTDFNVYMLFNNENNSNLSVIDNFNKLIYVKMIYKATFKHNKEEHKRKVETIEEIFVEDLNFIEIEDDVYTNKRGMPQESYYKSDFWNNCDCDFYYKNFGFLDSMNEL